MVQIKIILLLLSCGGGGGSPSTPIQNNTSAGYTYYKISDYYDVVGDFVNGGATSYATANQLVSEISSDSTAIHTRLNDDLSRYCFYGAINASRVTSVVPSQDVQYSVGYTAQSGAAICGPDYTGADVSGFQMTLAQENIELDPSENVAATGYSLPGALSGFLEYDFQKWGLNDGNLNEIVWIGTRLSERPNASYQGSWSGVEYVSMEVGDINYGTSCLYSLSPRKCTSVSIDNTLDADIAGSIDGFKTALLDMPDNSTNSYRVFSTGVGAYGMSDFLNLGQGSIFTAGCGNNPVPGACHLNYIYSAAGDQLISVDFAANTISGTISFQKIYYISNTIEELINVAFDPVKATLTNFSFSGTVSGNSFSGTISNGHYSGIIGGNFYGPQASEIGAIISVSSTLSPGSDFVTSGAHAVFTFVGKKN